MEAILYFAVLALLSLWAAFWVIRLAVRYGMNDALRMNATGSPQSTSGSTCSPTASAADVLDSADDSAAFHSDEDAAENAEVVSGRQVASVALIAALLPGCSSDSAGDRTDAGSSPELDGTPATAAREGQTARGRCVTPQTGASAPGIELRGAMPDGEVWALIGSDYPARLGREVKIVWRMTGRGALELSASGPAGRRIAPEWGPEEHPGSNWRRPGDEWGSGWRFPSPGCWTVHLIRGTDHATVGIRVAA